MIRKAGRPSWACRSFSSAFPPAFWAWGGHNDAPVFRIVLQRAQPLEGLFIGTISDLAEQFVGVLLKVQQVIYIHQHFLGLVILTLLKFFLEGI